MQGAADSATGEPVTGRFAHLALLTTEEAGRRNRRSIDGVFVAVAAIVTGLTAAVAASAPAQDRRVERSLVTVLGWADGFWRAVFVCALGLAVAVLVDALFRGRWLLLRDAAALALVEGGVGILLARAVEKGWFPVEAHLLSRWGFPELRLAGATGILVIAAPELTSPVRRVAAGLVPAGVLAAVVLGAARPASAIAALAFGLAAAAAVRLALGTPAGVPPTGRIRAELALLDVPVSELHPAAQQHIGAAEYVGVAADGKPLRVRVLGRDAQDTQRLARRWRQLAYRDPPRSVAVGRLEQVEHEALATLMAAQAGVRVPGVVTAALGPGGDALFVTHRPDVEPLEEWPAEKVSDDLLRQLWAQADLLHAAGISHGRLNLENVEVVDEAPQLVHLAAATLGAPQTAIDIDVAELLVACTVLVGPDRALAAACTGPADQAVARSLPYLERAALTPHLRDLARGHDVDLKKLREAAATQTGTKLPELVTLRRVRPRDFLITGLIGFAAYLLISKLAKIGFGTIAHELAHSNWAWVAVALLLAQLTFVPQAIALQGAVETPIPLLPTVVLQSADKFLNLTVPGSAGTIAMTIRFLQRLGAPTGEAISAGAIQGLAETLLQVVLVASLLPFAPFKLDTGKLSGAIPPTRFVVVIFAVLGGLIAVALLVPQVRRRIVPPAREAVHSIVSIAHSPRKLTQLFGGALAKNLVYSLTLGAAALAYGVHIGLAQLILVNIISTTLASLVPVPGGIGAAEAAIAGGLVAIGVPEATAFAIALTHRICTYYLPPFWGYASLEWLRRKGHV